MEQDQQVKVFLSSREMSDIRRAISTYRIIEVLERSIFDISRFVKETI